MRISTFLLGACVFCSYAEDSHSQNARVNINKNNSQLEEILNEIESQTLVMSDLEKYFGVSIVVENKNVLKYYFTGKFRQADGIDYALRVLQRDIRFKYERDDENQIIYIR